MKDRGHAEQRLAARYWSLLGWYPRAYREERGPELLGTLLDAAGPGLARPPWREARALVLGGLRMRAGTTRHRSGAATLGEGLRLGLLVLFAIQAVEFGMAVLDPPPFTFPRPPSAGLAVSVVLVALSLAAPFALLALGRVRLALPFVVVAAGVATAGFGWLTQAPWPPEIVLAPEQHGLVPLWLNPEWPVVVVIAALAVARVRPPAARPETVAAVLGFWSLVLLTICLDSILPLPLGVSLAPLVLALLLAGYVGALAYAAIDARPAVALALFLVWYGLQGIGGWLKIREFPTGAMAMIVLLLAPVCAAAWLGARRQARIPAPDLAA